jgi:hypothetical protein
MSDNAEPVSGNCLCGSVRYEVDQFARGVVGCHCEQCRKTSGHYVAATKATHDNLRMISDKTLKWYRSSDIAERGFCSECGSNLFWQPGERATTSIFAGTIDGETGLKMTSQIHCESKGDYYDLPDAHVMEQDKI